MVAYLQKSEGSEGFHQIIDFLNASHIQYALTKNPTINVSFIKQFWSTATVGTSANGEVELTATIDGQVKTITEASLRRHLKLEDNGGIQKLDDLKVNHKFRGGLLGIKLSALSTAKSKTVEGLKTAGYKVTTVGSRLLLLVKKLMLFGINKIHTDNNIADLLTKAFDVSRFTCLVASIGKRGRDTKIPQSGGPPKKVGNEAVHKELGDRMERATTTASSFEAEHDMLEDNGGVTTLPNSEIFEQLALMEYVTDSDKLTFQKDKVFSNMKRVSRGYSGIDFALFPTMISAPETSPSRITSSPSLLPKTHTPVSTPSTSQPPNTQPTPNAEEAVPMPHESPLHSVHSLRSDDGSLSLNELTDLYTSLSKKVEGLESKLKLTKQTYSTALTKLILRVKKLEHIVKASKSRRRARVVESDDEEDLEDPYKQGRSLIKELDIDDVISLVPPHAVDEGRNDDTQIYDLLAEQLGVFSAATAVADAAKRRRSVETTQTYARRRRSVSIGSGRVSTARRTVSIADVSTASELGSVASVKAKDKGKAIMQESEPPKKVKKRVQVQIKQEQERINFEAALELQKQLDEREEVAAEPTQAQKIDWSDPAVLRYHAQLNRPYSVAEVRKNMVMYLNNQGGYKMNYFKGMKWNSKELKIFSKILEDLTDRKKVLGFTLLVKARSYLSMMKKMKSDQHEYNLISWRLFDSCGIHILLMTNGISIHIMIRKKYPLTQEMLSKMLSRKLEVDHESTMAFELLKFIRGGLLGFRASTLSTASYS
ncbi:hypothetical protein Tco_0481903 [Tanacetum coccineum]